jgi:hypothetical protein
MREGRLREKGGLLDCVFVSGMDDGGLFLLSFCVPRSLV